MKNIILGIFIFIGLSSPLIAEPTSDKKEFITKVKLVKAIKIKSTETVEAMFSDMSPSAVQAGLGNARIFGHANFKDLGTGKYRVTISWHSISKENASVTGQGALTPPLGSKFVATFKSKDDKIEVGTVINAKGNFKNVLKAYAKIGDKNKDSQANKNLNQKDNQANTKVPAATQSLSGSGSSGAAQNPNTGGIQGGNNGNLVTTISEPCPDKVDLNAMSIFPMSKDISRDQNGNVVSQGACVISGVPVPIVKEYGGVCTPIYDYVNLVAMESYKLVATVNGTTNEIQGCQSDPTRTIPLTATDVGCSIRQDFTKNVAVQQTRLVYTDPATGTEVEARGCTDSTITYPHFLTATGCQPIIDPVQSVWVVQKKVAYTNASGQIIEAAPCAPTADQVFEAYQQTLEHDFATQQSYMMVKKYWFDGQIKTWIDTTPVRSTITYPHQYDTAMCSYIHDDVLKRSQPQAITFVDTAGDPLSTIGRQDITVCQSFGQPVNYAPTGKAWVVDASTGIGTISVSNYNTCIRSRDPGITWAPAPFNAPEKASREATASAAANFWANGAQINVNGWSKDITFTWVDSPTYCSIPPVIPGGNPSNFAGWNHTLTINAIRNTYVMQSDFLRADGTTFSELDPTSFNYNVAGGTTTQPPLR